MTTHDVLCEKVARDSDTCNCDEREWVRQGNQLRSRRDHINVVTGPHGDFTETFDDRTVATLVGLRLIEYERDGHMVVTNFEGGWVPDGRLHRFYKAVRGV